MNNNVYSMAQEFSEKMKKTVKNQVEKNTIQSTHIQGFIKEVLINNEYKVIINDEEYIIQSRNGISFSVNDVVCILLYNGDFSKKMIDFKKPTNW